MSIYYENFFFKKGYFSVVIKKVVDRKWLDKFEMVSDCIQINNLLLN